MIILIAGDTHTGKTVLAQNLLRRLGYPYLSLDHLKMGLIRAGYSELTPTSPERELTAYLWPVVSELIKTNIENGQNLIIEGCYIPVDFAATFPPEYRREIRYVCLAFTARYLDEHAADIAGYESAVERRDNPSDFSIAEMKAANARNVEQCREHGLTCILIDDDYDAEEIADEVVRFATLGG